MSDITKRALSASLKSLLLEKPIDKVSVLDITNRCGVKRQTFYYHFQDIADLVEWTCLDDASKVIAGKKPSSWQEGFLEVFNLIKQDKAFVLNIYHSVSRDKLELYLYSIVYRVIKQVVDEVSSSYSVSDEEKDFIINFFKYSFCGIVFNWIDKGMVKDPNIIVEQTSSLCSGLIVWALDNLGVKHN